MIPAAILCAALVAAACLHVAHRQRSLAERMVDVLYQAAAVEYAVAKAADSALCRYRAARQEIREAHVPMYAEVQLLRAASSARGRKPAAGARGSGSGWRASQRASWRR